VHGEGKRKIKVHGKSKQRTWRKFHIGIDANSQDILCCELTKSKEGDAQITEKMLNKMSRLIKSARGNGLMMGHDFVKKFMKKDVFALFLLQEMPFTKELLMFGSEKGMSLFQK
jgi:acetylornithine/succinyldiaminopimelate/putrescine aminotransferase